ncbi:MAG: signal peptide peptidase SppA [Planctomycetaceae bacterium]
MSGLVRLLVVAAVFSAFAPDWAGAQFLAGTQFFDYPKAKKEGETGPSAATIAVFELRGAVSERPSAADPIFGDPHQESLQSLVKRIDAAAQDDDVKAAVLLVEGGSFGPAQREELRTALQRFKDSNKPVHAHADSLHTQDYALLCGASNLSVTPTGDVWVTGLYGEGLYVRGLLDLIGVQPDFLTCGDYKSAAEMFTRTGPSPEAAEMQKWLYDGLFDELVKSVASARNVDADKAKAWIDQGLFSAEAAKEAGLIDAVEHRTAFVDRLKSEYGQKSKFDKSFGKQKELQLDLANPFSAMTLLLGGAAARADDDAENVIAIVHVDGAIMPGEPSHSALGAAEGAYSGPIRRALEKVAADEHVKGVVLRVSSPGGSAVASEVILDATKRVREKKPIIVSMGDVAASGGYYVSCGVDTIFADASTITGSIGVVSGKVATSSMWQRLGIHFEPIERGKNADIMSTSEKFTDAQRATLQGWMDEVYGVFKGHVTAARGERLKKPIDDLAGGRVYTGRQALDLGLVDEIGGLDAAIEAVAKKAGVDDYEVKTVPEAKNFLEQMLSGVLGEPDKDEHKLNEPQLSNLFLETAAPVLKAADPRRVRLLRQAAQQLDLLQREGLMLTMPLIDVP